MMRRRQLSRSLVSTVAALFLTALVVVPLYGWGISGHQLVTYNAVELLPAGLKGFFEANLASIEAFSNEPDLLSARDATEGPNHYFDLDAFDSPPFEKIPSDEKAFVEKFGRDALKKGRLPWAVGERYRALVDAFAKKDLQRALKEAGYLSHYAADSTMPLHATVNYKGQLSGNVIFKGDSPARHVHARFEIGMIDAHLGKLQEALSKRELKVRAVKDPAAMTFEALKKAYPLANDILKADRALLVRGDLLSREYYSGLYEKTGHIAEEGLAGAVELVASYWISAWKEAGSPRLPVVEVVLSKPPAEALSTTGRGVKKSEGASE